MGFLEIEQPDGSFKVVNADKWITPPNARAMGKTSPLIWMKYEQISARQMSYIIGLFGKCDVWDAEKRLDYAEVLLGGPFERDWSRLSAAAASVLIDELKRGAMAVRIATKARLGDDHPSLNNQEGNI